MTRACPAMAPGSRSRSRPQHGVAWSMRRRAGSAAAVRDDALASPGAYDDRCGCRRLSHDRVGGGRRLVAPPRQSPIFGERVSCPADGAAVRETELDGAAPCLSIYRSAGAPVRHRSCWPVHVCFHDEPVFGCRMDRQPTVAVFGECWIEVSAAEGAPRPTAASGDELSTDVVVAAPPCPTQQPTMRDSVDQQSRFALREKGQPFPQRPISLAGGNCVEKQQCADHPPPSGPACCPDAGAGRWIVEVTAPERRSTW